MLSIALAYAHGRVRGLWDFESQVGGTKVSTMADPDPSRPDPLARAEQAQAHSRTLQEQVAELAEAVAQVELDVARVHEDIAEQGGRWPPRPGSMPNKLGSSRQGNGPRRSACAWSGGLRSIGGERAN
jgi:hypothetical protein